MIDFDAIIEKHKEVQKRKEVLKGMRDRATDISVHLSDMPRGGGDGKQQERDIIGIVDAERDYLRASEELAAMKKELDACLTYLKKWQHRDAIQKRYMDGKSISQIMKEMGYEWAQTNRYITEARRIILKAESGENDTP